MSEKLVSPQTEMDPLQDALMDVRQMRETIEALRGEMESISFLKEQAVQEAKALSYDEIKQLKDTSGALRESLDDLNFDKKINQDDKIYEDNGVKILVDKKSFLYLIGTTLEFSGGLNGKGFVFNNPNANRTCGCGESFSL